MADPNGVRKEQIRITENRFKMDARDVKHSFKMRNNNRDTLYFLFVDSASETPHSLGRVDRFQRAVVM